MRDGWHIRMVWIVLAVVSGCRGDETSSPSVFGGPVVHSVALGIELSAMADLARSPKHWVLASLTIGSETYPDISIRFKGHRSLRTWAEKPAFRLAFDRGKYKDRRILGLRGFVLNNMVDDPSMMREVLGAQVFAALGVPAPRARHVELKVNGARFGLYTLMESIDEDMLARHFRDGRGALYEGEYGCDLYATDVWGFEQDGGEDEGRLQLEELARRMAEPAARAILGGVPIVDSQRVLGYLAASTLLADFDGYRHGHNYAIYRDPTSGRWSFIPWGFDRILKKDFEVFDSQGLVARSCFADAACRFAYVQRLHSAVQRFEQLELAGVIAALDRQVAPVVERDSRRPYSRKEQAEAVKGLAAFVSAQPQRLRAQLECWDGQREVDADGDGFGCMDCDDGNPARHPGAEEVCDGIDNDCSGLIDDAGKCGCPIEQAGAASYALCNLPMSFWDAERFCRSMGSTLAKVDSKAALAELHGRAQASLKSDWWVGLSDQAQEGDYVWADHSRPLRGLWARGEPDHYTCGQNCAVLRAGKRPGLGDVHCATKAPFVCAAPSADLARSPRAAR